MPPTDMFIPTTGLCNLPVVSVGPAMAQVVSWYPVTPEVRVSSIVSMLDLEGYSSMGTGFSSVLQFFLFILIPLLLHVHISCIYHQYSVILAFDSVIKEITSFPFPCLVSV
jgi:hypothetical protein